MSVKVMLVPTAKGTFRRSVRNPDNSVQRQIVFDPNEVVIVADGDMEVIRDDLGSALVIAGDNNKPDWETTRQAALASALDKLAANPGVLPSSVCTHFEQKMLKDNEDPSVPVQEPYIEEIAPAVVEKMVPVGAESIADVGEPAGEPIRQTGRKRRTSDR